MSIQESEMDNTWYDQEQKVTEHWKVVWVPDTSNYLAYIAPNRERLAIKRPLVKMEYYHRSVNPTLFKELGL